MRFRDLENGALFEFKSVEEYPYSGMERGPWFKVGRRAYYKPDSRMDYGRMVCTVGSIDVEVITVESNPYSFMEIGKR